MTKRKVMTAQQQERAALAARDCATCSSDDETDRCLGKTCLECGESMDRWSCAPGYCQLCAHDPRWVSLVALELGEVERC